MKPDSDHLASTLAESSSGGLPELPPLPKPALRFPTGVASASFNLLTGEQTYDAGNSGGSRYYQESDVRAYARTYASRAVLQERERCAKQCDEFEAVEDHPTYARQAAGHLAAAIRNQGKELK